jgi:protein involved in polysaccharide export with SLBB domain
VPRDKTFRIEDGDTVMVPRGNTFFVFGEVKRPGAYQLDKETNVLEGITIAGGFTDKAAPGRTRVIRTTDRGQQTIAVDMNDIIRRGQREKAIRLLENDVIVVKGWILDVVMKGVNLKARRVLLQLVLLAGLQEAVASAEIGERGEPPEAVAYGLRQ